MFVYFLFKDIYCLSRGKIRTIFFIAHSPPSVPKVDRDDLINPYWVEDPALKRGEMEYLPGSELAFWKDLIEKYLFPMELSKERKVAISRRTFSWNFRKIS